MYLFPDPTFAPPNPIIIHIGCFTFSIIYLFIKNLEHPRVHKQGCMRKAKLILARDKRGIDVLKQV